jgi:hypothetical protein
MKASRADWVRFTLVLLLALILIATQILGNQVAQAGDPQVNSHPAPGEIPALAPEAPQFNATAAALMAIEMAALTPPQYFTNLPIIIH